MRVNRRFLFWGALLVAIGGVLVAADLGRIDSTVLADVVRLWPLALIALGASVVLRRTRFSLPAMLVAALIPGLVLGAAFAVAPRFAGACGVRSDLASVTTEQGAFSGPASISVRSGCGTLRVSTADGTDWVLLARGEPGYAPSITSTDRSLAIDTAIDGFSFLEADRNAWDLSLPADDIDGLNVTVNAGSGTVDLDGADIEHMHVVANAASVSVDASGARVAELKSVVNVGDLAITLPDSGDLSASLTVNAGQITVCAPPGLGVRVVSTGNAEHVAINGDSQTSGVWTSANYGSARHHADLDVRANFGAVDINPFGGCS
jgi:LiaI-LiaF-like transmembrane region